MFEDDTTIYSRGETLEDVGIFAKIAPDIIQNLQQDVKLLGHPLDSKLTCKSHTNDVVSS